MTKDPINYFECYQGPIKYENVLNLKLEGQKPHQNQKSFKLHIFFYIFYLPDHPDHDQKS